MSVTRKGLVALGAVALLTLGVSAPAQAGGSDSPTPYTVDSAGITLPSPDTFPDGGHVNLTTSQGGKGIHFESLNNQPSGQWIGQSFIPWSAFGLTDCDTVSWVQVSLYNEHYGEGGQESITVGNCGPNIPDQPEPLTGTEERAVDAVCVEPLDGTAKIVTEERTWTQEYVLNGNAWVLGEKVYGDWAIVEQTTVESDDCAATVPPVSPDPPSEDRLPETGVDLTPYGLAGLAILVAGGAAIGVRKLALFKGAEG